MSELGRATVVPYTAAKGGVNAINFAFVAGKLAYYADAEFRGLFDQA